RARHLGIGRAEAAQSILALPAIERADDELLPALKHEGLARPFAGRMAQMAEEVDRMTCRSTIPDQAAFCPHLQVREVALAGQTHEPAGDDLPADNCARVGRDRAGWSLLAAPVQWARSTGTRLCGHGSGTPRTDRSSRRVRPCGCASGWTASARTRPRSAPSAPGTCWPQPGTGSG